MSQDEAYLDLNLPRLSNTYPNLILFFGGDITVSDMTLKALEIMRSKDGITSNGSGSIHLYVGNPGIHGRVGR